MYTVRTWLEELIKADEPLCGGDEIGKRVDALREMFQNYRNMTPTQFGEVMTTAHFANYFSNALSRAFYDDYAYMVGEWPKYVYKDTVPDFRDVDRYRMTEPGDLLKRREKEEAKATHISESVIHYGVDEFARQFDVSWQTILNDDLGKIKETPNRMAKAASRWLDGFVSALYDNAVTQAGMVALGAIYAGTGRLTAANLAVGINAMMQRADPAGNPIRISKIHLVIPPILRLQALTILESEQLSGTPNNDKNIIPQFIAGVHVDPYITVAPPNVPWYLFADPGEIPTVTLARLSGMPGPIVYKKRSNIEMIMGSAPAPFLLGSFETGDIEYMVEDIVGGWDSATYVGVTDFHGLYYSDGTTP